jgi:hypothetical protein
MSFQFYKLVKSRFDMDIEKDIGRVSRSMKRKTRET